jgi:hypothetical protein
MLRRNLLGTVLVGLPFSALAQQAGRGPDPERHAVTLGQDFDDLPPGPRARVTAAFREGSPDLDEDAVRQRWNAMTAEQRGETLTMRERAQARRLNQQQRPRGGQGGGPGGGQGRGQGAGRPQG